MDRHSVWDTKRSGREPAPESFRLNVHNEHSLHTKYYVRVWESGENREISVPNKIAFEQIRLIPILKFA
jgi:hypothetical protein